MCGSDYKLLHYCIVLFNVVMVRLSNEGCGIDILYGCDQVVTYISLHIVFIYQEVVTIVNVTSASSMTGVNQNFRKADTKIHISKTRHFNYVSLTRVLHVGKGDYTTTLSE